jgi:hypothetical protein
MYAQITKRVSPSLIPFFPGTIMLSCVSCLWPQAEDSSFGLTCNAGKKLFNNLSTDVVELRRTKLLAYMNNLVAMPEVMALCSEKIEAFINPNATTG